MPCRSGQRGTVRKCEGAAAASPAGKPAKARRRERAPLLPPPPVDESAARAMALRLAAEQLDAIGPEEYETLRLRRLFQGRPPMAELDRDLLHESVRKITCHGGGVCLLRKNNQTVKGENTL